MLTITPDQMKAFENASVERFKRGLRLILEELRPEFAKQTPDESNRFLDQTIQAAPRFGFTTKRQIALFAVVAHDCGARFYEDRRYPRIASILSNPDQEHLQRLEEATAYMHEQNPALALRD